VAAGAFDVADRTTARFWLGHSPSDLEPLEGAHSADIWSDLQDAAAALPSDHRRGRHLDCCRLY
jgi:hypothetical protein